jgi:branched-chain amino acid transport system permease protein
MSLDSGERSFTGNLREKLGITPVSVTVILILSVLPLFFGDGFYLRLLSTSLMMGVLAMGFDFSNGFINIVNFGYAAFLGIGAYSSGIACTKLGVSPWVGLFFALFFTGLIGFLLGVLTLRLRGIFAACMAWFLALGVHAVVINWVSLTRGSSGLIVPPIFFTASGIPYYYLIIGILIISYLVLQWLANSQIGMAFLVLGQDTEAAVASGVNDVKYKIINFTVSCMIAGFAGWFYAHYFKILTPKITLTTKTVEILAISYIGGRGTLWGSIISALILLPVLEMLKPMMELRMILYGIFLILVMIYYPGGLATLIENVKGIFTKDGNKQLT